MCPTGLNPGYEEVFTVTDYYDGPRQGIANYMGNPHFYDCIFDDKKNDYSDLFHLTPLEPSVFQLAMESWSIWERWESAFRVGRANRDSHPALPEDRPRFEELKLVLDSVLKTDIANCIVQKGSFEVVDSLEQVKWQNPGLGQQQ